MFGHFAEAKHVLHALLGGYNHFALVGNQLPGTGQIKPLTGQVDHRGRVDGSAFHLAQGAAQPFRLAAHVDDFQVVQSVAHIVELLRVQLLVFLEPFKFPRVARGVLVVGEHEPVLFLDPALGFVERIEIEHHATNVPGVQLQQVLFDPVAEGGGELGGVDFGLIDAVLARHAHVVDVLVFFGCFFANDKRGQTIAVLVGHDDPHAHFLVFVSGQLVELFRVRFDQAKLGVRAPVVAHFVQLL